MAYNERGSFITRISELRRKHFILGSIVTILPCLSLVLFKKDYFFISTIVVWFDFLPRNWLNVVIICYLLIIGYVISELLLLIFFFLKKL
jgi:hypothetical protein